MNKRILSIFLSLALLLTLMPVSAMANHVCVDSDRDYWCDDCGMLIYHKCVDSDRDGWCELCDCWIPHDCADSDGDDYCDQCSELMNIKIHVTVYSNPDIAGKVQLILYEKYTWSFVANVDGNPATHTFTHPADSFFQLIASKLNHPAVTLNYNTDREDIYIEINLCPMGDASGDGKVNVGDVARIYAFTKGIGTLDEYAQTCADVNGDGKINIGDAAKVYAHAKQTSLLW